MVSPAGAEWESHTSASRHVCLLGLLLVLARVADLQAEVVSLRGHKNCERATLSLLQELRQVQASVQLQDSELRKLKQELQQAAWVPEKEALEVRHPPAGRQLIPTHRPGSPIPRGRAAASWTLSPAQCCCPSWEHRESHRMCLCWSGGEGPGLHSAHTLLLAVSQPPEPEQDAGPGQEVFPCLWCSSQQEGRGWGEQWLVPDPSEHQPHGFVFPS